MKKLFSIIGIVLLLAFTALAQKQTALGKGRIGLPSRKPICSIETTETIPQLIDYPTYLWYVPIDDISESVDNVNGQWVQGRVYLAGTMKYLGIDDHNTVTYIEPVDGTTPIDGGHAFNAGWELLVTVDGWDGLIVQSPFGSWVQHVQYDEDTAVVRIDNHDGWLYYSLNGVMIYAQLAPGLDQRDLRALYLGSVDSALVGSTKRICLFPDRQDY